MPAQYGWSIYYDPSQLGDIAANISNSSYDANCTGGVQWVWVLMRDCVDNWQGQASAVLGLLSMLLWMIVGFPYVYLTLSAL